ncbi:MAG: hypothetical protein M3Z20_06165 [Chloroflexota bacterium]|nr:hypothetical protein [Chloroflexota bacterium]
MTDPKNDQGEPSQAIPDDLDRAQTTAADVESAGRSCIVIIALAIVIVILLGVWVLYSAS